MTDSIRNDHLQPIHRRQFLRRAALLGLSMAGTSILPAACGNPPASPQAAQPADRLTSVRMACWSQPLTEQANVYAAQEFGWFEEQGLDFTFVPGAGGGDALKHILAGNADFAFTNVEPLFFALQEGAKLRAVYNIYPQNVFNVVALNTSNIGSIAELKGRKVGVYSQSSGTRYNLLVMLHSVGLQESDIEVIATGIANFGPLQAGDIDATAATDTGLYAAQQAGLGDADVWWARDVLNTPSDVFVVTEETYQNQQDVIVRFLKAYKQGSQWMLEHPDKAAELATKYATDGKDVERNRAMVDLRNASTESATTETKELGVFDLELLKEVERTFFDLGITKQRFDVENIFTNQFVANV